MTAHDHEHNHETITLIDENGVEKPYEILFTFDSEDYGKSYVLVYEAGHGEDEEVELEAYAYIDNDDERGDLLPIVSDEEWDLIEEVLNTFIEDDTLDF